MVLHELTTAQLRQAVQMREQIEALQEKFDALLGGSSPTKAKRKVGRPAGKRTMSPATVAKMRAAQQARWAKIKGKDSPKKAASKKSTTAKTSPAKATPAKASVKAASKKKVMSPEAKAKIAAAMKARWEAKKKGNAAE